MSLKINLEPLVVVKKYGYEYFLVETDRRSFDLPQPNFMGYPNMALRSCKKIGGIKKKRKRI